MIRINLATNGQKLLKVNCPKIASGDKNIDFVHVDFCPSWDGYAKTAVFYRREDDIYYATLDNNNECVIPWEVLQTEGVLYFGIFGVNDDKRQTSEIISYKIEKGSFSDNLKPSDPTPDVYDQILANYREIAQSIGNVQNTIDTHTGDKNNPHNVTADQVGARPNDWVPSLTDIGAAPSGYGLGELAPIVSDCNAAKTNGWYRGTTSSANRPANFASSFTMFVVARNTGQVYQYFFAPENGYVLQRWTMDGGKSWVEEWVNPPMLYGVEYATTERHNGKTVWTVLVDLGSFGSGEHTIDTDFAITMPLRCNANIGERVLPMVYKSDMMDSYIRTIQCINNNGKMQFRVLNGSKQTAAVAYYAQAWYLKN
jgi:hypothetical protein